MGCLVQCRLGTFRVANCCMDTFACVSVLDKLAACVSEHYPLALRCYLLAQKPENLLAREASLSEAARAAREA